ncbi:MAG: hypothetical protein IPJ74_18320 [Saprospiraceae bacterium]|nr:hypothetical protein [Saprospiraceae bacterium]
MKRFMAWASLFFILPMLSSGQEFILTGRILDVKTQKGVSNITVKVVGYSQGQTDDEGVFRIAIPNKLTTVKLEVAGGYKSLLNSEIPVPKSSDAMIQMLVEKLANENDLLQKEVARLKTQNKLKSDQIKELQSAVEDSLRFYKGKMEKLHLNNNAERDSLLRLVEQLTNSIEGDYVLKNKRESYQHISTDLLTYVTRLKDLRDWIAHAEDVLLNQKASENFNKTLELYSQARDDLFVKQADYQDQVQKYWEKEVLTNDLKQLFDLALGDIHDTTILPLKDSLLAPIGDFYTGKISRLSAQKKVKKQATATNGQLLLPIKELERRVTAFNQALSN